MKTLHVQRYRLLLGIERPYRFFRLPAVSPAMCRDVHASSAVSARMQGISVPTKFACRLARGVRQRGGAATVAMTISADDHNREGDTRCEHYEEGGNRRWAGQVIRQPRNCGVGT